MREAPIEGNNTGRRSAVYPANIDQLGEIRDFLEEASREHRLSESRLFDLRVAVSEVAANAMEQSEGGATVRVTVWGERGRVLTEVEYEGDISPPRSFANGRMGPPLVAALADELEINVAPKGRTSIKMWMRQD